MPVFLVSKSLISVNYNGGFGYLSLDNRFCILCFKPCMFVPWNVFYKRNLMFTLWDKQQMKRKPASELFSVFILSSVCLVKGIVFYLLYKNLWINWKQRQVSHIPTEDLFSLLHMFQISPICSSVKSRAVDWVPGRGKSKNIKGLKE